MDTHDQALELELAEVSGYLARQLLIDDDDVRVARENRLISVAGEILQRRLYLGEAVGRSPRDIVLYLRISVCRSAPRLSPVRRAAGSEYDPSSSAVSDMKMACYLRSERMDRRTKTRSVDGLLESGTSSIA